MGIGWNVRVLVAFGAVVSPLAACTLLVDFSDKPAPTLCTGAGCPGETSLPEAADGDASNVTDGVPDDVSVDTSTLAATPPMGWSTWYEFGCSGFDESVIRQQADALVSTGLRDLGYDYVLLDDCWQASRDESGNIQVDPGKFSVGAGLKPLADYLHSRGLKLGVYTDAGGTTCQGRPGSLGYEGRDAKTYAAWGVDFVKDDWCSTGDLKPKDQYKKMHDAIVESGRPMVLGLCNWGRDLVQQWGRDVVHAQLWRTTFDIVSQPTTGPTWNDIITVLGSAYRFGAVAGPYGWNDPDHLQATRPPLTDTESRAHYSLWAEMAAPLILTTDLRSLSASAKALFANPEVIAVDQDPAGYQGTVVLQTGTTQVWSKPLATAGERAVVLFNTGATEQTIAVHGSDLGLADGAWDVRDLWARTSLGTFNSEYSAKVPAHGAAMLKVKGTEAAPPRGEVFVSELRWAYVASGFGVAERNRSNNGEVSGDGNPITIAGTKYAEGIGVNAPSRIEIVLGGACTSFDTYAGVDDESTGTVTFEVSADGTTLATSGLCTAGSAAKHMHVDVTGRQRLTLRVTGGDDSFTNDHADWASAKLTCKP